MKVKVRCIKEYYDLELKETIKPVVEDKNYERVVTRERADTLEALNLIQVLGVEKEEKETAIKNKKTNIKKQVKIEEAVK